MISYCHSGIEREQVGTAIQRWLRIHQCLMPMVSLMLDTGDDNVAHDGDLDAETYR